MDEFGIRSFRPTSPGLIEFARKHAHGHRDDYVLEVEERKLIFPIETSGGNPRVRQPEE
jgi:hypothetical protein